MWIMSSRQKSKAGTDIPLLPKALEIIAKYDKDPICLQRGTVLPVRSNQKMNEYLKEIAELCDVHENLNTHKARRTFASTVTLNNGVSIHVVKEMLGHYSVKQTEEYAITEQESISREMNILKDKLKPVKEDRPEDDVKMILLQLKRNLKILRDLKVVKSFTEKSSFDWIKKASEYIHEAFFYLTAGKKGSNSSIVLLYPG